jgi:hypothetical protein
MAANPSLVITNHVREYGFEVQFQLAETFLTAMERRGFAPDAGMELFNLVGSIVFAGAVERLEKRLGDLKRFVTEAVSAPKAAAKPAARKATAAQSARKASPAKAAKKPVKKMVAKTAPTISKKARSAGVLAELAQSPATQAVRLDRAKQRSAVTAAKSGRLKIEGLGARRIGHAAARGRRTQARRDTRPG